MCQIGDRTDEFAMTICKMLGLVPVVAIAISLPMFCRSVSRSGEELIVREHRQGSDLKKQAGVSETDEQTVMMIRIC
jgi:hypothetical protein